MLTEAADGLWTPDEEAADTAARQRMWDAAVHLSLSGESYKSKRRIMSIEIIETEDATTDGTKAD